MIEPVEARLPLPGAAERVIAPPYDALSPTERRAFAEAHPDNFMAMILSPGDGSTAAPVTQQVIGEFVDRFYAPISEPAYFVYEMWSPTHRQRGVVGAVPVDRLDSVRGHERVIDDRVDALADFYRSAGINTSPVALAFEAGPDVVAAIDQVCLRSPILDYRSEGVRHRIWQTEPDHLAPWLGSTSVLYITDGHHRVAAAQRGDPATRLLVVAFPAHELHVLGYHRSLTTPVGPSALLALEPDWSVERVDAIPHVRRGRVAVRMGGRWYSVTRRSPRPDHVVDRLDVAMCHREIITGSLRVPEENVAYLAGVEPDRVPDETVLVLLEPPSIEDIIEVADARLAMPPKSTWFVPKVRSGVFVVDR